MQQWSAANGMGTTASCRGPMPAIIVFPVARIDVALRLLGALNSYFDNSSIVRRASAYIRRVSESTLDVERGKDRHFGLVSRK